jgi:hypothetical protein
MGHQGLMPSLDRFPSIAAYLERLYAYNYFGSGCQGFDAGLVDGATGAPRPAYGVFRSKVGSFVR